MKRLSCLLVLALVAPAAANWYVDVEAGPVFSGYNDVRIPGNTGTLFSLTDDLKARTAFGFRARVSKTFGDRHWVSVLVAPLRVHSYGTLDRDVLFAGQLFPASSRVNALYRFDSYRLTYRYGLVRARRFNLDLGLTAKIRDAEIGMDYGPIMLPGASKKNTGFVPIISFRADWSLSQRLGLVLDGDALAAPQGRAEDVTAALRVGFGDRVVARVGYRMLEGGSDVDEVYGFSAGMDTTEGTAHQYSHEPYCDTKLDAEEVVRELIRDRGLPAVIVQPTEVFGPDDENWTMGPLRLIRKGRMLLASGGSGLVQLVYQDDVVDGILAAARHGRVGEAYILGGPAVTTVREYFLELARIAGKERLPSVPGWLAIAAAGLAEFGSRLSGRPPAFTRGAVRGTMVHAGYRSDKARDELGFVAKTDLATGLKQIRERLSEPG